MLIKATVIVVGCLAGLVAAVAAIGMALPKAHVASRSVRLRRGPPEVWDAIHDVRRFSEWRPGLERVERLPDADGRPRWKEVGSHGAITFELVEASAPARMVTRIADPSLPFGGSWTYVVDPTPEGSRLTIVEQGEVYNPLFRFMSRFVFGHTATIDAYLAALAARLGEGAAPAAGG
jgi:hypothetical protein